MTRSETATQRAQLVARWRASQLSQAAFARRHLIHPRTFWDWVRQIPTASAERARAGFVPLQVLDARPIDSRLHDVDAPSAQACSNPRTATA